MTEKLPYLKLDMAFLSHSLTATQKESERRRMVGDWIEHQLITLYDAADEMHRLGATPWYSQRANWDESVIVRVEIKGRSQDADGQDADEAAPPVTATGREPLPPAFDLLSEPLKSQIKATLRRELSDLLRTLHGPRRLDDLEAFVREIAASPWAGVYQERARLLLGLSVEDMPEVSGT